MLCNTDNIFTDARNILILCAFDAVMYASVRVLGRRIRRQTNIIKCKQQYKLFYILNMECPKLVPLNILIDEYK
jgi:hypothetical protein